MEPASNVHATPIHERGLHYSQIATYIMQNCLAIGHEKEAICLIFMCCGSAINETAISLELETRGIHVSREIYFDKFVDQSTITNLSKYTHASRQIVTSVDRLEDILLTTKLPRVVLGINANFVFDAREEAYRYHAFFSLCHRLSKEHVCQARWINILDGRNGNYSHLPCIAESEHIRVYSTSWWTYANEMLSHWEVLLGKR